MKLVGLMCARSEDWIISASLRTALRWCDEVVLVDHSSTDQTYKLYNDLAGQFHRRIRYSRWYSTKVERANGKDYTVEDTENERWDEMEMRQHSLDIGRKYRGTHFAIVDADEILTANLYGSVRTWFMQLKERQLLDVPMLPMRTLSDYQDDDSVWSQSFITLGFADDPTLAWKPRGVEGYQHHARPPKGCREDRLKPLMDKGAGGVMHYQFANQRRLVAKHALYRMVDHIRWPDRETVAQLNEKYDRALEAPLKVSSVPRAMIPPEAYQIRLEGRPWQEDEIRRMVTKHGKGSFAGLDLKGLA